MHAADPVLTGSSPREARHRALRTTGFEPGQTTDRASGGGRPGTERRSNDEATKPRRAPMSVALGVVLGGFVLIAVASVMGVGIWSGYSNTIELLEQKADILVSAAESQTTQYLDAAGEPGGLRRRDDCAGRGRAGPGTRSSRASCSARWPPRRTSRRSCTSIPTTISWAPNGTTRGRGPCS